MQSIINIIHLLLHITLSHANCCSLILSITYLNVIHPLVYPIVHPHIIFTIINIPTCTSIILDTKLYVLLWDET